MPTSAVGLSLNYGYAGNISRVGPGPEIENRPVNSASAAIPFGAAVILNNDNSVSLADATLTAANFAGVAVAEVRQMTTYPTTTGSTGGTYAYPAPCDILKRGIICVKAGRGTLTAGGAVYIRTVLNGSYPASLIGDFEAAADGSNNILIPNLAWNTGKTDANGIAELKIKTQNN